jgi:hypothetical protein
MKQLMEKAKFTRIRESRVQTIVRVRHVPIPGSLSSQDEGALGVLGETHQAARLV